MIAPLLIPVLLLIAVTLLPPSRARARLPQVGVALTVGAIGAISLWHSGKDIRPDWRLYLVCPPIIIWSAIGMAALIYGKSGPTRLSLITGILVGAFAAFIVVTIYLIAVGCVLGGDCL